MNERTQDEKICLPSVRLRFGDLTHWGQIRSSNPLIKEESAQEASRKIITSYILSNDSVRSFTAEDNKPLKALATTLETLFRD